MAEEPRQNENEAKASDGRPAHVRRAKEAAQKAILDQADALIRLSHRIHDHPELGYEEFQAAAWVGEALDAAGLDVTPGVADLPTALSARAGSGPLVVAICAEYDALPGIGHACGHNVIAAAAVGAGIGLRAVVDGLPLGVRVLGTPAEEGGGGKIRMMERGAFDGVHAAMMVHPAPTEAAQMVTLAVSHHEFRYEGREAHASMFPEEGVNAADALVVAQVALGLLRQQFRAGEQVHGIVTDGGDAPNVIPAHAGGQWLMRAPTLAALEELTPRVERCFEAGALATGAVLHHRLLSPPYSEFRPDPTMLNLYRHNAIQLGRDVPPPETTRPGGSTDMANVSLVLPAIHPMLGLDCLPAVNHQAAFAEAARGAHADRAVLDGAVALAWTAIDLATDPAVSERLLAARG
jgi:amidohydrolase